MVDIEKLKPEIIKRLKPLNPEKIILFGSYAYGEPYEDSDIYLYVVTGDDVMPQSLREKSKISLKVMEQLEGISEKYPADVIVHTKPMHKKFIVSPAPSTRKIQSDVKKFLY